MSGIYLLKTPVRFTPLPTLLGIDFVAKPPVGSSPMSIYTGLQDWDYRLPANSRFAVLLPDPSHVEYLVNGPPGSLVGAIRCEVHTESTTGGSIWSIAVYEVESSTIYPPLPHISTWLETDGGCGWRRKQSNNYHNS